MAFTLRVTQGEDQPEDLSFDGGEVRMGRTADNDLVIRDPSSSRSHARVYEEDGQFFVEDLKSANGTTLNDRPLTAPAQLEQGDRIAIGGVVLVFGGGAGPSATLDGEEEPVDAHETILKPPSKSAVARPPPARRPTAEAARQQAFEPTAPKGQALRRPSRVMPQTASAEPEEPPAPSAADRARERRELQRSSMGRLQVLWSEFPRPTRIAVSIIGALIGVGLLGALISAMIPRRVAPRVEPLELVPNGDPIAESFGEGEGVDFERSDMKSFTFTYAAPTAIVGVLHYQAGDCGKDEVSIELSGSQLGSVPPQNTDSESRVLDQVLPSDQLRVGEPNEVVFDNVNNPPASDPWRVWNVQVEVIPVPKLTAEEAAWRAKEYLQRASDFYDLRAVGAINLFRSWKQYRDAWLLLEATSGAPPELIQLARGRMREIRPQLDQKCAVMLVTYQHAMNQRDPDLMTARSVLADIPNYFEKEHPCFGMSRGLLGSLEELGESE